MLNEARVEEIRKRAEAATRPASRRRSKHSHLYDGYWTCADVDALLSALDELVRRLAMLADLWESQAGDYPGKEGRHAAAAVRLCARELRAITGPVAPVADGGAG